MTCQQALKDKLTDPTFSKSFAQVKAWPADHWRQNSSTMHWSLQPTHKTAAQPRKGHLVWFFYHQRIWLSLSFNVTYGVPGRRTEPAKDHQDWRYRKQYSLRLFWHTSEPSIPHLEEVFSEDQTTSRSSNLTIEWNMRSSREARIIVRENNPAIFPAGEAGVIEMFIDEQNILEATVGVVMLRLIAGAVQAVESAPGNMERVFV